MILDRFSLKGKTAVVTGGGRGIGKGIAIAFAEAGADIVIPDLKLAEAEATAERIRGMGRKALGIQCDVGDRPQVSAMLEKARSQMGRLDILVNNAAADRSIPLMATDDAQFEFGLRVTLKGVFICSQIAGRMMYEQKSGVILNISSRQSLTPSLGQGGYGIAKAGVNSLTRTLAWELAPYVRVNAILPGPVETEGTRALIPGTYYQQIEDIVPVRRWGTP
ncbi:MAG: SDR family NAD(P)-dependent oxidoreductase, partial [Chloroflexi bacterium]|nr:SDR family NAD(P)-dependent oxidoreductase [Chloroflexota bacterium]